MFTQRARKPFRVSAVSVVPATSSPSAATTWTSLQQTRTWSISSIRSVPDAGSVDRDEHRSKPERWPTARGHREADSPTRARDRGNPFMGEIYGRQQHKSPETKMDIAGHRAGRLEPEDQGRSQESAEIADVQVAGHLLRYRADRVHALEGAVAQPGGRSVLPRADRVSMNTERPANAVCVAKKRSSRSKFGDLPTAVLARSVPADLRAHILGWDGVRRRDHRTKKRPIDRVTQNKNGLHRRLRRRMLRDGNQGWFWMGDNNTTRPKHR
jgi:hypothetical protein